MDRPHNLMQADHAGEAGPEPSEQLRNDPVTASRSSNVTLGHSSGDSPGGFPDTGAEGPIKVVNWRGRQARQRSTSSG